LADLYRDQGRYDAALQEYRSVMETHSNANVEHKIAEVLARQGKTQEAIKGFRRALEMDARRPTTCYLLAQPYLRLRRYKEAADYFQRALKLAPVMSEALFGLARAFVGLGRSAEAIEKLEKCLELDPTRTDARNAIERLRGNAASSNCLEPLDGGDESI